MRKGRRLRRDSTEADQLHQFGVAGEKPLGTEGTRESRFEGKRGARGIEIEDGGT